MRPLLPLVCLLALSACGPKLATTGTDGATKKTSATDGKTGGTPAKADASGLKFSGASADLTAETAAFKAPELTSGRSESLDGYQVLIRVAAAGKEAGARRLLTIKCTGKAAPKVGDKFPVVGDADAAGGRPYATVFYNEVSEGEAGLGGIWSGSAGEVEIAALVGSQVTFTLRGVKMAPDDFGDGKGTFTLAGALKSVGAGFGEVTTTPGTGGTTPKSGAAPAFPFALAQRSKFAFKREVDGTTTDDIEILQLNKLDLDFIEFEGIGRSADGVRRLAAVSVLRPAAVAPVGKQTLSDQKLTLVVTEEDVEVPAGKFHVRHAVATSTDPSVDVQLDYWFDDKAGLVKMRQAGTSPDGKKQLLVVSLLESGITGKITPISYIAKGGTGAFTISEPVGTEPDLGLLTPIQVLKVDGESSVLGTNVYVTFVGGADGDLNGNLSVRLDGADPTLGAVYPVVAQSTFSDTPEASVGWGVAAPGKIWGVDWTATGGTVKVTALPPALAVEFDVTFAPSTGKILKPGKGTFKLRGTVSAEKLETTP